MALVMTVTDNTNTVTLTSTDGQCLSYGLDAPMGSQELASDQHEIELIGGNSAVATNLAKLNRLIDQARRWQKSKGGPRVFATIQVDGSNTYRSELVDGNVQASPEQVNYERALGTRKVALSLVRRNWWDGAEATITRTSLNSDFKIFNNGDFSGSDPNKKINFLDVDPANLAGDLPAPLRMHMSASGLYSSSPEWYTVSCTRSEARLEYAAAESGWNEVVDSPGVAVADTDYTNGNIYRLVTTTADQKIQFAKDVGTYMAKFPRDVGVYRIYMRMAAYAAGDVGTFKVRPYFVDDFGAYTYGTSQYIDLTTTFHIFDLGTITFPGGYSSTRAQGPVKFGFVFGTTGKNIDIDWSHVIRQDWVRRYSASTGFFGVIYDDHMEGDAVYYNADGNVRGSDVLTIGSPVPAVFPGKWNRFYVHVESPGFGGVLPKDIYTQITLLYRPRYLTIS